MISNNPQKKNQPTTDREIIQGADVVFCFTFSVAWNVMNKVKWKFSAGHEPSVEQLFHFRIRLKMRS